MPLGEPPLPVSDPGVALLWRGVDMPPPILLSARGVDAKEGECGRDPFVSVMDGPVVSLSRVV